MSGMSECAVRAPLIPAYSPNNLPIMLKQKISFSFQQFLALSYNLVYTSNFNSLERDSICINDVAIEGAGRGKSTPQADVC